MRAESQLWRRIRPALLAAGLDPIRVENPIHPGTPDVNLADGRWVELKSIEAPVRDRTILRIAHFTPQQRVWLLRRWKAAPRTTWLLLEVRCTAGDEWLLFDGDSAARVVGRATLAEHRTCAWARTTDGRAACRLLIDQIPEDSQLVDILRACLATGKLTYISALLACGITLHVTGGPQMKAKLDAFDKARQELGLITEGIYLVRKSEAAST